MRRCVLFTTMLLTIMVGALQAQTVVFTEDFESATTNVTSSGTPGWAVSTSLFNGGLKSDSTKVVNPGDSSVLTTNAFSTVGNTFVTLEFDHICKIEFFDACEIYVSADNGVTWTKLTGSEYTGSGNFGPATLDKFSATTYSDWLPGNPSTPTNTWWKHESFDISTIAGNTSNVKVSFVLRDMNNTTQFENYGWFIDDIKVSMSPSELIPPTVSLIAPIVQDTVFTSSPFVISAYASDASGIDTVELFYTTSDGGSGVLGMTEITTDTFQASIPFPGFGRSVNYYVRATDLSNAANMDSTSNYEFYCKYSNMTNVEIGNCASNNSYAPVYISSTTSTYKYSNHISLYTPADIGGGGQIEKISWKKFDATGYTAADATFDIYMKHSTASSVSSAGGTFATELTGATLVYSSSTQNLNTAAGWQEFVLSTPFSYNGSDNLMIFVDWHRPSAPTASYPKWCYTYLSGMACTWAGSSANPTSTNGNGHRPDIKLDFTPVYLTLDAGISDITNPGASVQANQAFNVECVLKNYGSTTLTSATINWSIDGVAQTPFLWTGSLDQDSTEALIIGSITLATGSHTIEICTDLPNNGIDLNTGNDCFSILSYACNNILSGAYTIDPSGSGVSNFTSFADAAFALDQCGINGPVTFTVASGTYNEQIELKDIPGISATNTITFESATGDSTDVIVEFDAIGASDNFVVKFDAVGYITFKEMTFKSLDTNYARVFWFTNGNNNIDILNNEISAINTSFSSYDQALVHASGVSADSIINIKNNRLTNGYAGLYIKGLSTDLKPGVVIENNIFRNQDHYYMRIEQALATKMIGNDMMTDSTISSEGVYLKNVKKEWEFAGNTIIHKGGGRALSIWNCNSVPGAEAMVYNNMMVVGQTSPHLVDMANGTNIKFVYNTFRYLGNSGNTFHMNDYLGSTDSITFMNNIFVNESGEPALNISASNPTLFIDYNNYLATGSTLAKLGSSNASDIAAWQAITSQDAHSMSIDPYFLGTLDLHVSNNMLNAVATPIAGITTDIDGEARDASNPDVGADEFVPSPYDVAILEILSPIGDCGLATEDVIIRIKNVGSADINGGLNVSYQIVGAPSPVTEAVSTVITAGDTLDYTFSTQAVMNGTALGADTIFELIAYGDLTNDNVQFNDTAKASVFSGFVPAIPTAFNATVQYNTIDTLYAQSNETVVWFDNDTTDVVLARDTAFITPIMYYDKTYYVASQAGSGMSSVQVGNGTSTTSYAPAFGNWDYSWSRMIYNAADLGGLAGQIDSISFFVGNSPSSYTMLNQKIYMEHTTDNQHLSYAYVTPSAANQVFDGDMVYNGSGKYTFVFSTPFNYNGVDNILIHFENWDGSYVGGYPQWQYTSTSNTVVYKYADNNFPTTNGSVSSSLPNCEFHINGLSCMSARVPLQVTISGAPSADVGVTQIIAPVDGIELTAAEQITVEVTNFATNTQDTIPLAYQIDGAAPVIDTFFTNLASAGVDTFTFSTTADLSAFADYNLVAYTELNGDINNNNDTIQDTITNAPLVYCTSNATNSGDSKIEEVIIGSINYNSSALGCETYTDNTAMVSVLSPGNSYPMSVTLGTCGGNYTKAAKAWIDFNRDGDFDDPGEEVADFGTTYNTATLSASVSVPTNATVGITRMRVVCEETSSTANVNACGTYSYGETEDYSINIIPLIAQDAGVIEIVNLPDTTLEGNNVTISAVVKNFGTSPITSVDVSYVVNNGTATTMTYTSTIAPADIDTVALTPFISPAGISSLCAYTTLTGDAYTFNDTLCDGFFGTPNKDAMVWKIAPIQEECGMTTDTVKVWVINLGGDTINGCGQTNPTVSFAADLGLTTVVTEPFTNVVAPGDTAVYTFTTLADFTNLTQFDSIFNLAAWIDLTGDFVQYNDTAYLDVNSLHIPNDPVVASPISVPYGSPYTVNVTSNDTVYWYHTDTSATYFHKGASYTTPFMYTDDTLYVKAIAAGGAGALKITEMFLGGTDYIEIENVTGGTVDATGWKVIISNNYNDINAANSDVWNLGVFQPGEIQTKDDSYSSPDYWGSNIMWGSSNLAWAVIVDNNNNIVDAVFVNASETDILGSTIPNGTQTLDMNGSWTGAGVSASSDAVYRLTYDSNDASDFVVQSTGDEGIQNVGLSGAASGACESNMVQIILDVTPQPANDVGLIRFIDPNTGVNLGATEDVTIRVKNFGSATQTQIPVAYQIDNNTPVQEIISATLATGDSIDYTFTAKADLSVVGSTYALKAYTELSTDVNALNDTMYKSVDNNLPVYCPSYATNTGDSKIDEVVLNTINENSAAAGCETYTDNTSISTELIPGMSYPMSVTLGTCGGNYTKAAKAWIDFNRDGDFDDAGEEIADFGTTYNTGTLTATIQVPFNASQGMTQMRVVCRETSNTSLVSACGTYSYGETEDYGIIIGNLIPNDAGVELILSPANVVPSVNQNLDVRIRNYGTDPISSVDIAYVLNNGTPVVTTYSATTLQSGDSVDVSLGIINLIQGNNALCAYTILNNDSNTFNDETCMNVFVETTVSAPYFDDFETSNIWFNDTLNNQWEYGTPAGSTINNAHSGNNAWVTVLDTVYDNSVTANGDYLYTPQIMVMGLDSAYFSFWHQMMTDSDDYGMIQVSVDNGSWMTMGAQGVGSNWYNASSGGLNYWTYTNQSWQLSELTMDFVDPVSQFYMANVLQFRFVFVSNGTSSNEGWAIDDFAVAIPAKNNDVGVNSIDAPTTNLPIGTNVNVTVTLENYGLLTQSGFPVTLTLDNNNIITDTYTGTLTPGAIAQHTFSQAYTVPAAAYTLAAFTELATDELLINDTAYAYLGVTPGGNDVGVSAIVAPAGDTLLINGPTQYVTIRIKNYGTNTQTSIPVEYDANGNVVSATWTGTLNPGDSVDYTFTTPLQIPFGIINICGRTNLVGDVVPSNDETCKQYVTKIGGVINGVVDGFKLDQNVPNPATNQTQVIFEVPSNGEVNFSVVDVFGRQVYNEFYNVSEGQHSIDVNTSDLAAGTYYYFIEFKGMRLTRKMIITK